MDTRHRSNPIPAALRLITLGATLVLGTLPALAQNTGTPGAETNDATAAEPQRLEAVEVAAERRLELPPQDVPAAVTAFEAGQIDVLKVRNLTNLSIGLPNVQLDDRGVARGIAHFSIRGLGGNGSLPALDPTVGLFVDGVYLGTNLTALHDVYDLEAIEVLRGPQNVRFGRSTVGGAVVLETRKPTDRYEATVRSSVEGGGKAPNFYVSGTLNAPLADTFAARLTVYSNQDQGWFKNKHDGRAFGAQDYVSLRPVFSWQPTETLDLTLRYEWQDGDGDGAPIQNRRIHGRDSHDFAIDEEGHNRAEVHFLTLRADWDVAPGNGTLTNVFGWRDSRLHAWSDVDSTPWSIFHGGGAQAAEQFSNELRYAGVFFDRLLLTTGFSYFTNDVAYHDGYRLLIPGFGRELNGGGNHTLESFALFLHGDYDLTDRLTLTAGLRWTHDEKDADVTSMAQHTARCHIVDGPACPSQFEDDERWHYWSPEVGLTYRFDGRTLIYGHWRRSSRPGGYNLRDTSVNLFRQLPPAQRAGLERLGLVLTDEFDDLSFDDERVDTFELGVKKTLGARSYVNAAFFYNFIDDVQRSVLIPETLPRGWTTGRFQTTLVDGRRRVVTDTIGVPLTRNAGDVETWGFEVEGRFALTADLTLLGSAGYLEADATKIRYDLNGDGQVDGRDADLELPHAPTWTYSLGFQHTLRFGARHWLVSRASYAYRDKSYDASASRYGRAVSRGFNRQQKIVDAGMDLYLNGGQWVIGSYGRNLLNFARAGAETPLVQTFGGGTIAPLERGRTFGLELTYNFRGA